MHFSQLTNPFTNAHGRPGASSDVSILPTHITLASTTGSHPDEKAAHSRWPSSAAGVSGSPSSSPPAVKSRKTAKLVGAAVVVVLVVVLTAVLATRDFSPKSSNASSTVVGAQAQEVSSRAVTTEPSTFFDEVPSVELVNELGVAEPEEGAVNPSLVKLFEGNKLFADEVNKTVLATTAEEQTPEFLMLGCSDSRVPETTVFKQEIGSFFTVRNIGNQLQAGDLGAESGINYGIVHLGVQNVLVTGHYGCGAIKAAMASPDGTVGTNIMASRIENFITPIRTLYETSTHPDIVARRALFANSTEPVPEPESNDEPAFRALVEENVRHGVSQLAKDPAVLASWAAFNEAQKAGEAGEAPVAEPETAAEKRSFWRRRGLLDRRAEGEGAPVKLFIHGIVYDVDTGLAKDLNISQGPEQA